MIKKLLAAFLVVAVTVPAFVSCSASNASALSSVPGSANSVVIIQVSQLLSNPALLKAYDELASTNSSWPQSADKALTQFTDNTGIDPHQISSMVIFAGNISSRDLQNANGGVIATGSFDESTITKKIEQETNQVLTSSNYKGVTVYSSQKDNAALAFIAQNKIVFGTARAVKDTIDVFKGDASPLSGKLVTALAQLGSGQIKGVFLTPGILRNQVGALAEKWPNFSPKVLQDAEMVAFAANLQVLNLNMRIDTYFSNDTSAQDANDAITGLISLAKAATQAQSLKTALGNINVSTSGSQISVSGSVNLLDIPTIRNNIPQLK